MTKRRICPECGEPYSAVPALSRKDGKTEICPDCGTKQALDSVRDLLGPGMTDQQWEGYKSEFLKSRGRDSMDRTLYNASGCKDKTAHDAICSASKPQTQVFRSDWTRRDNEADMFVKMVKRLAKGFNFKLCDRIRFEDPETGKKYL